jgi:hypothetical protein
LSDCSRPLEPLDIEALADGDAPPVRADAAAHASQCDPCGELVRSAGRLEELFRDVASQQIAPPDLADRVLRVRPFSRAERWSLQVWRAPLLLLAGLVASGVSLVAGIAGPREQVGFAAATVAAMAGLARAAARWFFDLSRSAPAGLEALSQLLAPTTAGWAALLLLLPAGYALTRVFSRAFARK